MFVSSSSIPSVKPHSFLKTKQSPRRSREHVSYGVTRRRARCILPALTGPGVLALSCGVGLATQRLPSLPPTLRGPPASFITAALLRTLAGAALQPACDAVLSRAPAGLALLLLCSSPSQAKDASPLPHGMLAAFCLGAIGATAGAALGSAILARLGSRLSVLHMRPEVLAPLAAAFAATYIGGSLNFVAVVSATGLRQMAPQAVAAALSVDLVLMAAYFGGLFFLSSRIPRQRVSLASPVSDYASPVAVPVALSGGSDSALRIQPSRMQIRVVRLAKVCALPLISVAVFLASRWMVRLAGLGAGADILIVTFLPIAVRRIFGNVLASESTIFVDLCLALFFAALGGCVTTTGLGNSILPVAVLACSTLLVHTLLMLFAWKTVGVRPEHCLIASNANIGGPTTASAFAAAEGYDSLVGAAACIGAAGYIVATPIALLLKTALQIVL